MASALLLRTTAAAAPLPRARPPLSRLQRVRVPGTTTRRTMTGTAAAAAAAPGVATTSTTTAPPSFVVAVDGPAASGKGTIAKRLATELQLAHLDTGLLYRGVGWAAVTQGVDVADEQAVAALAAGLDLSQLASNPALRGDEAAVAASKVSSLPAVRAALLEAQRRFAAHPPGNAHGCVLDGRDIGTVICPDAPVKLYVTADVGVRAQRRLAELTARAASGGDASVTSYEAVLADMQARDDRDMNRATAPLKPAADAVLLDTTGLSAEDAFARARGIVAAALAAAQAAPQPPTPQPVAA